MSEKYFKVSAGIVTPAISFVNTSNSNLQVSYLESNSLSFSGSSGQLFSVVDSMAGAIFSVNDISGIPSIEVYDTGNIRLAETFGNVLIGTAVDNGYKVNITGNVYANSNVVISGTTTLLGNLKVNAGINANNSLGTAGQVLTSNGTIAYWSSPAYGCFHKLANITAPAASTVYSFDWYANTTAHIGSEGVTVTSAAPTDIRIATAGSYNVSLEMHVRSTVNAVREAYLWLATNNVDMAESCIKAEIKSGGGSGDAQQIITKTWLVKDVQRNDYITLRFAVNDQTGISLEYTPAIVTPYVRPAIPSATISITPIG
jgi:hypothetical protein